MSILTTSQLTFCDLKDSYSIHLDKEYIGVACDSSGVVIYTEAQYITINYRVLAGGTRIAAECIACATPDGVVYQSMTKSTSTTDGIVTVWIPVGSKLDGTDTATMKLTFQTDDDDAFTFERHVTFIKTRPGKDGSEGIEFQIYSTDGFEFNDDVENIELETAVLKNGSPITTGTYTWYYYDKASDNPGYIAITNEGGSSVTTSSITVNVAAPYALCSLKCVYTSTDGQSYTDYVSLTKKQSGYIAVAKFWDETNTVSAGQDYVIAYVDLYKDNERVAPYVDTSLDVKCTDRDVVFYDEKLLVGASGRILTASGGTFNFNTGNFVKNDLVYIAYNKVTSDGGHNIYNVMLAKYTLYNGSLYWFKVEPSLAYKNNLFDSTSSPVVLIPASMIDGSRVVDFEVWNKDYTSQLARTSATVLDFGDAAIGAEPTSKKVGQLWLDTSVTPNVLKIWNGENWVASSYQKGNTTYTSKPENGYIKGDLWILDKIYEEYMAVDSSEDLSGIYYRKDGDEWIEHIINGDEDIDPSEEYYQRFYYTIGTMLRAIADSNTFDIRDWEYVDKEGEEQKQNIRQYFTFDKYRGFKIGQTGDKFYVNIDSQEMGFYDNSDLANPDQKVVSISNKSAKIKNATLEESASFLGPATFNQQINIQHNNSAFVWKIESNGSLSLSIG